MIKKISLLTILFFLFVLVSVVYNYILAQKAIKETKPSVLFTDMVSYPETVLLGNTGTFFWKVQTPNDLATTTTTIYWGYQSTPSAVTVNDPPQSLGYPYYTQDYLTGKFKLPDTFDSQIIFEHLGKVYFRSYAKVGDQNLWSHEYSTTVTPNQNDKK